MASSSGSDEETEETTGDGNETNKPSMLESLHGKTGADLWLEKEYRARSADIFPM